MVSKGHTEKATNSNARIPHEKVHGLNEGWQRIQSVCYRQIKRKRQHMEDKAENAGDR